MGRTRAVAGLFGALDERAEVACGEHDHPFAVQFPGHERCGRGGDQGGVEAEGIGRYLGQVEKRPQRVAAAIERMHHHARVHRERERVQPEREAGDHAEVAAAAAQPPQQLGLLVLIDLHYRSVGGDQLGDDQVVAGQSVGAGEPSHPAAEGQPADAGMRDLPAGHGEPVVAG